MEQLIDKYYLPLKAYFYKLSNNSGICEDLTHDVIIKVIRSIEKYRPVFNAKFSSWLYKVARNEYLNYVQRGPAAKEIPCDENTEGIRAGEDSIDEAVEKRLLRQKLRSMLKTLPEEKKTLILLRYYNEFSYGEIAKITGLHEGKIKWKLHDTVKQLKKLMTEKEGGTIYNEKSEEVRQA